MERGRKKSIAKWRARQGSEWLPYRGPGIWRWANVPTCRCTVPDGNHQSALGAFLTACVLCGQITGESPASLGAFPYPNANDDERKFLAEMAAKALAEAAAR